MLSDEATGSIYFVHRDPIDMEGISYSPVDGSGDKLNIPRHTNVASCPVKDEAKGETIFFGTGEKIHERM